MREEREKISFFLSPPAPSLTVTIYQYPTAMDTLLLVVKNWFPAYWATQTHQTPPTTSPSS